jgi:hypothetical protein
LQIQFQIRGDIYKNNINQLCPRHRRYGIKGS